MMSLYTALQLQRQVFSRLSFPCFKFFKFYTTHYFVFFFFCWKPFQQAATKHQIPRKTLEYYVKGKATNDSYQKMGLPQPQELQQYAYASEQQASLPVEGPA